MPTVNAVDSNETIHDFGGVPRALYDLRYPAVQPHLGPEHHLLVGRTLAPLRIAGMLIIGSGSFTHDLAEFRCYNPNIPAPI